MQLVQTQKNQGSYGKILLFGDCKHWSQNQLSTYPDQSVLRGSVTHLHLHLHVSLSFLFSFSFLSSNSLCLLSLTCEFGSRILFHFIRINTSLKYFDVLVHWSLPSQLAWNKGNRDVSEKNKPINVYIKDQHANQISWLGEIKSSRLSFEQIPATVLRHAPGVNL